VAGATTCPKNGVAGPPHFWPRGGFGHPIRPNGSLDKWVCDFRGWSGHPERPKKKKKKKGKNGFRILGVARPPPRAWGWLQPPPTGRRGWPKPPPGPDHPQNHKPIFRFFFFFGLSGWPDHPQSPGVASATPIRPYGVAEATPWPKMGWSGHPIFGQGVAPATLRFSPFLSSSFFFLFFFLISFSFFKKKKNLKPKMPKTTLFWAKRCHFGRVQNGVVLECRVVWTNYY
jgi:hypothetical protein